MVEERLALWIYEQSLAKQEHSDYEKTRIVYGWTVLFYNLFKILLILLVSALLYSLKETLICYIPFCLLRVSGFGYHAKSNIICNLSGVLLFTVVPCIVSKISQLEVMFKSGFSFLFFGVSGVIIILIFAPSFTENSFTEDIARVHLLKFICLVTFIGLFVISRVSSAQIGFLMSYGMGIALLFLLPNYTIKGERKWKRKVRL